MPQIAVVGGGVIGAAIAYELSRIGTMDVLLLDQQPPAQASTGAALGVLMGAISHKTRGRAWQLRETSLKRYETLVPELMELTGRPIGYNRHGIVMWLSAGADLANWDALISKRQEQGWRLECWSREELSDRCPHVTDETIVAGIYSPGDRQIDPVALTLALVEGAKRLGAEVRLDAAVSALRLGATGGHQLEVGGELLTVDGVVVAAGLGSTLLTQAIAQPVDVRPVLGQAMRVRLPATMGNPDFQPVITGNDIHIVPLAGGDYWVGATVEFPAEDGTLVQQAALLESVWKSAIAVCPSLAPAERLQTWSGLRPRPFNRPAPIIEAIAGQERAWLATGHYRNGVLLAPATAEAIGQAVSAAFG